MNINHALLPVHVLFSLLVLLLPHPSSASPYIVTSYVELIVSTAVTGLTNDIATISDLLRTSTGFQLCPRRSQSLSETYVDIRQFTAADWASHPTLSADIVAAQKQHLLGESPTTAIENGVHEFVNEIRH